MTLPLWILAIGSALIGLPGSPWMHHAFQNFITPPTGTAALPHAAGHGTEHVMNHFVMTVSVALGLGGIFAAAFIYLLFPKLADFFARILRPLYLASYHKLWFDELYQATVIRAWYGLGRLLNVFDAKVVDGAVNGAGIGTMRVSDIKNWIDMHIVDGAVNAVGAVTRALSGIFRRLQTGFIQNYLFVLFVGILIILFLEQRM
jgi:NADH:ubiquinone oxidoreductase subunit 5 (subunit L)/multisubunit Na+/H+ antiporter MnhA subunit